MASRFRKPHIGKQPMKFYVTCQVRLSPLARGLRGPRPRSDTAAAPKRQPASLHRPSCSPCACTTPAGALPALNPTPNPHGARTSAVPTQPAAGHVPRPAEAARRGGHRLAPRAQSRDGAHGPPLALPAPQPTPSARRGARRAQVRPDARARRTADSPSRTRPRHRPAACPPLRAQSKPVKVLEVLSLVDGSLSCTASFPAQDLSQLCTLFLGARSCSAGCGCAVPPSPSEPATHVPSVPATHVPSIPEPATHVPFRPRHSRPRTRRQGA